MPILLLIAHYSLLIIFGRVPHSSGQALRFNSSLQRTNPTQAVGFPLQSLTPVRFVNILFGEFMLWFKLNFEGLTLSEALNVFSNWHYW